MPKVWFITGANRGLGLVFAEAALERGDKVAAGSRKIAALDDLKAKYGDRVLPLSLDVTNRADVFKAVKEAVTHFGRLDVVVNNAGYGLMGTIEEISEAQFRQQIEVNVFGVFHVVQAVLPVLRGQGSGHIVQISSIAGIGAFPGSGAYNTSKWALEAMSEALAQEVKSFGIKVTLVEPGPFKTEWGTTSAVRAPQLPQYDAMRAGMAEIHKKIVACGGDPRATGPAILAIVDAPEPPLRVFFGPAPLATTPGIYAQRLKTWEEWGHVSTMEGMGKVFTVP